MASALPNEGGVGEDLETAEIQADAVGFATGKGRGSNFRNIRALSSERLPSTITIGSRLPT